MGVWVSVRVEEGEGRRRGPGTMAGGSGRPAMTPGRRGTGSAVPWGQGSPGG
jgi:hypothetical protein